MVKLFSLFFSFFLKVKIKVKRFCPLPSLISAMCTLTYSKYKPLFPEFSCSLHIFRLLLLTSLREFSTHSLALHWDWEDPFWPC